MKDTFCFKDYTIGVRVFDGIPYFCARDMAKAAGYVAGMPVKTEDKPIKVGSYNYVSLHKLGSVLIRTTGARRHKAQELLDAIQREYLAAMPVPSVPVAPAHVESDYEMRIKRNQIEIEIEELRAQQCGQMAQIHQMQKEHKQLLAKLYEREQELAALRRFGVVDMHSQPRLISNG